MHVERLRRFSREFTATVGALDHRFLGRDRPLAQARVLWEIGVRPDHTLGVSALRSILSLDSGHASRLLRQLEHDGLIEVTASPDDARQRIIGLTAAGRDEWKELDRRSDEFAAGILDGLDPRRRDELVGLLDAAGRLLVAAEATFDVVEARSPEALTAMTSYFDELDATFDGGFDPGDTLVADAGEYDAPNGEFVLLRRVDRVLGCGGVHLLDAGIAEIKRMWIDPQWRGLGLAPRLLADLEERGRRLGATTVRLDTNGRLTTAIAMYERSGYHSIGRYNDNPFAQRWFEKDLH